MDGYLLRRVLSTIPTLLGLSLLVFGLAVLAPGDPAEELAYRRQFAPPTEAQIQQVREELGLDRPLLVQYATWVGNAARGDLGTSLVMQRPVAGQIRARLGATAELAVAALLLTVLLAIPFGILAAIFHRRWPDNLLRICALTAASIPSFFFAYLLIGTMATRLGLFPVAGRQGLSSLVLPALALALGPTAVVSRLLRSSLLEALSEDYITTARSKGVAEWRVVWRHAVRNAVIPVVTVLGSILGHLLTGAVIIEFIFAWPGLGRLTLEAVVQRDYPMIQGIILFAGFVFVVLNLLVDLSYRFFDPRVRLGASA
jgi:peptide/nickel transport system permease protein